MSERRIFRSSSNAEALSRAAEFLEASLKGSKVLVLAPTRSAADEFAGVSCRTGFLGVHRITLPQLAADLAARPIAERRLAPLSPLGMEALSARVVHVLRREGELDYFEPVADMPGFARALASTFAELRLEGVPAQDLARTGKSGVDLARLFALYEKELGERRLADLALVLRLATEVARNGPHRLLGLPLLLLDVPLDSQSHRQFLQALASRSPAVCATVLAGDEGTIEEILGARAEEAGNSSGRDTLARLRSSLFSTQVVPAPPADSSLEFFSAPGEGPECVEIARRIRLLAGQGVAFDQMAILLRSPERYQPLVEEALRRAGVPGYFSRGTTRPDPAGRAFLTLLACAAEGCTASRFAEYLSLGQAPVVDSSGAPRRAESAWAAPEDARYETPEAEPAKEPEADPDAPVVDGNLKTPFGWEKLLVDAAVIGGHDRWARRLRGLEAEFRLKLESGEAHQEHLARQVERLGYLQRFALPLIDALDSLPKSALWGAWLERLTVLAQMSLRSPESVLSVLNELQPMNEVGPVGLDEVYGVLAQRLRFLRREPPLRRYGRVFVSAIEEARGRCFDVVFLPGLAEGLFPRRAFEDPLLLDVHREKVAGRLARQDERVARERLLARGAAAAAGSRLIVSYPRMETAQARPRVPSFYAMEIVRAAEGKLPDLRAFEQRALRAAPSRLNWPAPRTWQEAIDDAEYDLVSLEHTLRLPRAEAKGSARYLVEVNPHLARSLRTRGRRWRNFWSGADGIVDPEPATLEVLAQHRLSSRSYSPSALQQFAACPYRFLLYGIHALRPREEPLALEQMDPLTRGALFHAAQFALFRELEHEGRDQALDTADQVLDRVAAEFEERLAPAIPRVWRSEVESLRTDLRGWVRQAMEAAAEWQPLHFELGFGLAPGPERDPASHAEEARILHGVRLRGSMDLVEKHRTRGVLRVTDHKTGKAPEAIPQFVGGGTLLQPLLYALAAEQLLPAPVESGRLFYCTQRGGYTEIDIPLSEAARERIRMVAETIDQAIGQGFLPAAPQRDACEHCDYRLVCGPYEVLRVQKKIGDRLEPLTAVRNLP